MSEKDRLETAAERGEPFLMETDYIDDPDRPGAVLDPRRSHGGFGGCSRTVTIPRFGSPTSRRQSESTGSTRKRRSSERSNC